MNRRGKNRKGKRNGKGKIGDRWTIVYVYTVCVESYELSSYSYNVE